MDSAAAVDHLTHPPIFVWFSGLTIGILHGVWTGLGIAMTGAVLHRLATQYRQALDTELFHCQMA